MPTFTIEVQEQHDDGWRPVGDRRPVEAVHLAAAIDWAYHQVADWPVGRAWRVAGWAAEASRREAPHCRPCPYIRRETTDGGFVDTLDVPRAELHPGSRIFMRGTVYVVREPIKWELTAPPHWVWTRRADSPELTGEQLRDLGAVGKVFDGTGYGFFGNGPDHIYHLVVAETDEGPGVVDTLGGHP